MFLKSVPRLSASGKMLASSTVMVVVPLYERTLAEEM